jgi:hypothetical protein
MKYIKEYNQFLLSTNTQFDKSYLLVEKSILNDFSRNFWRLSLNSSVFTIEERIFIKENLINVEIDLINENFFKNALKSIVDKGGEFFNKVKSKIENIQANLKSIISGVIEFLKSFVKKLVESIIPSEQLIQKAKGELKSNINDTIKKVKQNAKEWQNEKDSLKSTTEWIKSKFVGSISGMVQTQSDGAEKSVDQDLDVITEVENESIDILSTLYIREDFEEGQEVEYVNKEGENVKKKISKIVGDKIYFISQKGDEFYKMSKDIVSDKNKAKEVVASGKDFFMKWILGVKETYPPKEGNATWWIKLILKIIGFCMAPWGNIISAGISTLKKNVLEYGSVVVSKLKGPGPFKFAIITGLALAFYDFIKKNIDVFGKALSNTPFDNLPELIKPFKEQIPYVNEIETCLAIFVVFVSLINLVGSISEMAEEKPPGYDQAVVNQKINKPAINLQKK